MFYFETCGSPYEMGYQTGQATRLMLGATIDLVAKRFRHWEDTSFAKARARHTAFTEKLCPELMEEVTGIADGAGMPFKWVYLANFYASLTTSSEGCTNFIFTETPDGPLLGRTTDLPVHEGKHSGVRVIRGKGVPAILGGTWPGTVWVSHGMNEAGLVIGGSSCSACIPAPEEFLNPHVVIRYVLSRTETVEDAITLMSQVHTSNWGANYAMVDRTGAAAVVEKAGAYQGVRRPEGRRIWCTNHALTPELLSYRITNPAVVEESEQRFQTMDRLTRDAPIDRELAHRVLEYDDRPGAVCRYGDDDPLQYETESAAIFYPASGEAEFCFTHPGRDPWHQCSLQEPDRRCISEEYRRRGHVDEIRSHASK